MFRLDKQRVHYDKGRGTTEIVVGESCTLYPLDHPSPYVSNTTYAYTSPVVAYDSATGEIETQNMVYIPV